MPFEQHLRAVFDKFGIETVFDVGANAGQFRDFLRDRAGFEGVIHSFEPVSHLSQKLVTRARSDSNWQIHNVALGATDAKLEINVTASDTFSSFREASVGTGSPFASSMTIRDREEVAVRRADDLWPTLVVAPQKLYLKVDTQGFDLEVLRGSVQLLREVPALQFELPVQRIYKGTPHYLEMLQQLEDWGFVPSGLFPITVDDKLRVVEYDCVMVKAPNA